MIYIETSVALAEIFVEDRRPPASLWESDLISSRLLEYEIWTRVNGRGLGPQLSESIETFLARVVLVELDHHVMERALEPFPGPVRTLDAIHLSSVDFLRREGQECSVASYDKRLLDVAKKLGFELAVM